jgi:hypothetical protein
MNQIISYEPFENKVGYRTQDETEESKTRYYFRSSVGHTVL